MSFASFVLKYALKRRIGVVVIALTAISSLFFYMYFALFFNYELQGEYSKRSLWPGDIRASGELVETAVDNIRAIQGVDFVVYPSFVSYRMMSFKNKTYFAWVSWCNVENPVFPLKKYLTNGRFFELNDTDAIMIDSLVEVLLNKANIISGTIGSQIKILNRTMNIIGAFQCQPVYYGIEEQVWESYWNNTNVIQLYIPLKTFRELNLQSDEARIYPVMHVKVKEGSDIEEVADQIGKLYPQLYIQTVRNFDRMTARDRLLMLIPAIVGMSLLSMTTFYDAKKMQKMSLTLRAVGWLTKDIAKNAFLYSILSSSIGVLIALSAGIIISLLSVNMVPSSGCLNSIMFTALATVGISPLLSILFSLPAAILASRGRTEGVIRLGN